MYPVLPPATTINRKIAATGGSTGHMAVTTACIVVMRKASAEEVEHLLSHEQ